MFLISSKFIRFNKIGSICRLISDSSSKKQINEATNKLTSIQDEVKWFSDPVVKTDENDNTSKANIMNQTNNYKQSTYVQRNLLLKGTDLNEKRKVIKEVIDSLNDKDFTVVSDLTEIEWNMLLECNTINEIRITLKKIPKERYYALLKQKQKILVAERRKLKLENTEYDENGNVITNYSGRNSFCRQIGERYLKTFLRDKLLASIRTNSPSIVFDFRYEKFHEKRFLLASLYRQYAEIVSFNRKAPEPFQIYFCNYNSNSYYHQKYSSNINYDENLIIETEKSYMDLFPKEKIVYLSKDATNTMKSYNPDKVYVIGSIIDSGFKEDRFASYSQAKRDGVECLRLPIDENVKWTNGQKDLAMLHVFNILVKLYNGSNWKNALTTSLPSRFTRYPN